MDHWPFADPPDMLTITMQQILDGKQPIQFVAHESNGMWQWMPRTTLVGDPPVMIWVSLRSMVEQDASLVELADLPKGWEAWREQVGAPWQRQEEPGDWVYF